MKAKQPYNTIVHKCDANSKHNFLKGEMIAVQAYLCTISTKEMESLVDVLLRVHKYGTAQLKTFACILWFDCFNIMTFEALEGEDSILIIGSHFFNRHLAHK